MGTFGETLFALFSATKLFAKLGSTNKHDQDVTNAFYITWYKDALSMTTFTQHPQSGLITSIVMKLDNPCSILSRNSYGWSVS